MKNQKLIRERHELVKKNKVPKRLIGDTATEKFMDNVRPDLKEKGKEIRLLALKKGREKKDKLRKKLKNEEERNKLKGKLFLFLYSINGEELDEKEEQEEKNWNVGEKLGK